MNYWNELTTNPMLLFTSLLALGTMWVNGWTDAPNAIATCVSTKSLSLKKAALLAAVMNLLGLFTMSSIHASVAVTIFELVDFSGFDRMASAALCAALCAIVLWATLAWRFGIPTSESHALLAGISGAAIALTGDWSSLQSSPWLRAVWGLFFTTITGFCMGFTVVRVIRLCCRDRTVTPKADAFFGRAQILGAAAMAFMHGAQDGQKFMGIFILGATLCMGQSGDAFSTPVWLIVLCALTMALGTAIGGKRIIDTLGNRMVRLDKYQGFAADLAAAFCLLFSTIAGLPVSTTHTKTTAMMGAGAGGARFKLDRQIVREMCLAWLFTFPCCGLIGFGITKLLLFWMYGY